MEATTIGLSAYIGLMALAGSLAAGSAAAAFAAETVLGLGRGKFWDKLGRQIAAMGAKVLLLFVLLLAPALAWGLSLAEDPLGVAMSPMGRVLGAALAPLLAGCLGLAVYSSSWGALRRNKGLHRILGGVSLLALLGGMYSGLNIGVAWGLGHGTTAASLTETLWLPAAWEVGAVWAAILGNGLGAAGVFGMGYLLLRRNKDDFGRDYYRFAMGRAALLGLILPLPVAIGAAWLGLCGLARSPDVATPLAVAGVAALAAVWLNARVMRSRHPLRLKGEVIAACLLAAILDAALALSLLSSVLEIPLPASLPI